MIDSAQKRSSAVRMGIQNVFIPNGSTSTAQDRMNQAWWYGGTFVEEDNFFFWRATANDNQGYLKDEDNALFTAADSNSSSSWSNPSLSSTTINSDSNTSLSWGSNEQIYDRN